MSNHLGVCDLVGNLFGDIWCNIDLGEHHQAVSMQHSVKHMVVCTSFEPYCHQA